eukprot:Selendium_serpulae@DN10196_c0_g1_i1.p1
MHIDSQLYSVLSVLITAVGFVTVANYYFSPEVKTVKASRTRGLTRFKFNFLSVYLLAFFCDWLQGPYLYTLYEIYGFTEYEIGVLYSIGFVSSGAFGIVIGPMVDRFGRKKSCQMYCVCYIISNLLKLYNDGRVLAVSHVFGGVATSLLFSAFDTWMLSAFEKTRFRMEERSGIFSLGVLGNGGMAVTSGLVASWADSTYGPRGPFKVAIVPLAVCCVLIALLWEENYGSLERSDSRDEEEISQSQEGGATMGAMMIHALKEIFSNPLLLCCGCIEIFFECGVYTCVMIWSPAIHRDLDRGICFSCFMACMMIGSQLPSFVSRSERLSSLFSTCAGYLLIAAFSMLLAAYSVMEQGVWTSLASFCGWELAVGCYFAHYFIVRAVVMPNEARATILNLLRVPLYFGMLAIGLTWSFYTLQKVCLICCGLYLAAFCAALVARALVVHGRYDEWPPSVASDTMTSARPSLSLRPSLMYQQKFPDSFRLSSVNRQSADPLLQTKENDPLISKP